MRVRDWQDIVADVVESDADPDDWRAVAGQRADGVGEDFYLGHPAAGVYQLKTYAKNPFEVKGVGTELASALDADLGTHFPEEGDGRFAVRDPPRDEDEAERTARRVEETIKAHAEAPTTPDDLFTDLMDALDAPAFGPLEYEPRGRSERVRELAENFTDAEDVLEAEFENLIEDDGIGRGFQ